MYVCIEQSIKQERWLHHHPKGIYDSFECIVHFYGGVSLSAVAEEG